MRTTVVCPNGHYVTLEEPVREALACPRCGAVFGPLAESAPLVVPLGISARPESRRSRDDEEADDDRPRKRRGRDDDDDRPSKGRSRREEVEEDEEEEDDEDVAEAVIPLTRRQRRLNMVRLGILFHILKLWTYLAAMLFGVITLPLLLFLAAFGASIFATILLQITFNLSMTLAPVFGVIGSIMCAFVPPKAEARGTIIVSVVFDLLAPVFGLLQLVMWVIYLWGSAGDARVERLIEYMLYARLACTLVAWWLFQLYLRKLAFYMQESLLASEALNVIVHFLIATIIGPTLVVATVIMTAFFSLCIGAIAFVVTLGWLIYFIITFPIRQFRLLFLLRSKIYNKFIKLPD